MPVKWFSDGRDSLQLPVAPPDACLQLFMSSFCKNQHNIMDTLTKFKNSFSMLPVALCLSSSGSIAASLCYHVGPTFGFVDDVMFLPRDAL